MVIDKCLNFVGFDNSIKGYYYESFLKCKKLKGEFYNVYFKAEG